MKTKTQSITKVIHDMVSKYVPKHNTSCKDINTGNCENFALEVVEVLGDGEVFWGSELDRDDWSLRLQCEEKWENHHMIYVVCCHCFIVYEGKYYDSETPEGVDWPDELPCFIRLEEYWAELEI